MPDNKQDIIQQLRRDILPLQGYKPPSAGYEVDLGLGPIEQAFPNGAFPTGAIHDFLTLDQEQLAATTAFLAAILSRMMERGGIAVWIGADSSTFAPGLAYYNVDPDRIIFVAPTTSKTILWTLEESLRCDRFIAVLVEITDLSFVESRRLQLVVEQSRVTGFIIRHQPRRKNIVASVAQWRITALPTQSQGERPGRGFPRWHVELLKVRNRQPVACDVEWTGTHLYPIPPKQIDSRSEGKTG